MLPGARVNNFSKIAIAITLIETPTPRDHEMSTDPSHWSSLTLILAHI